MVRENKARVVSHTLNEKELRNKIELNLEKIKSKCTLRQYICILKLIKGKHLNVYYKASQKGFGNLRCNSRAPKELIDDFATLSNGIGQIIIDLLFEDNIMFEQIFPGVRKDSKLIRTATSIRDSLIAEELKKLIVPANQFQSTTSLMSGCKAATTFVLLVGSVVCVAILESMSHERVGFGK